MTKMDWAKQNRLDKARGYDKDPDWAIRRAAIAFEREQGKKAKKRSPKTAATSAAPAPPKSDKCDIWVTWGADSPWNPTPGIRCVQNITSMAEARRLGLR